MRERHRMDKEEMPAGALWSFVWDERTWAPGGAVAQGVMLPADRICSLVCVAACLGVSRSQHTNQLRTTHPRSKKDEERCHESVLLADILRWTKDCAGGEMSLGKKGRHDIQG